MELGLQTDFPESNAHSSPQGLKVGASRRHGRADGANCIF
jgi:hypothetical protein